MHIFDIELFKEADIVNVEEATIEDFLDFTKPKQWDQFQRGQRRMMWLKSMLRCILKHIHMKKCVCSPKFAADEL